MDASNSFIDTSNKDDNDKIRPYEGNEINLYGTITGIGNLKAFVQIKTDLDFDNSLPEELVKECCSIQFNCIPFFLGCNVNSIDNEFDKNNDVEINIVINNDEIANCGIKHGKSSYYYELKLTSNEY